MRRIRILLAACGLASVVSIGLAGTRPGPPAAGATRIPTTAPGWTVLGAAGSLPTLSRPAGLAVGPRGNVYVADSGNHRIVEIAPNGRLLAHFGEADLAPQGASGLAVSAAGTVYAADSFHHAIRVYSPGHRRIASWPVAIPGASRFQLAVAVGGKGTVIVAVAPESRCTIPYGPPACATSYILQRRASLGRLLGQFRTPVTSFGAPNAWVIPPPLIVTQLAVTVNPAGDIYVAAGGREPCYKDCRVFHFLIEHAPGGRVLGHWGADELDPTASWPAVATGGRGNVFLADDLGTRIEKRAPGGRILARWPVGTLFPAPLECSSEPLALWQTAICPGPEGVAVTHNGTVYVSDPGSGRILVLSSGGRLLAQWGPGGAAPGRFWFPASVALDVKGQLWVNDMANARVQVIGADGRFHVRFAVPHPGTGMALDRQGNVYIGQQLGQEARPDAVISKFSPSGKLLARWGNLSLADPPSGIAIAPNGDIVVVSVFLYRDAKQLDLNGANIVRLSPAGKQLSLIHLGSFGPGPGIAVDAQETITIAYGTPPHFARYSSTGTLLASWGAPKPSLPGEIVPSPAGITLDAAGDVFIADTAQDVVQEYGASGALLHVWGTAGSYSGQFHHPGGIAVAPDGTIYVSDTENHRVQRLVR
ncbi:MAG TPA: NHL repeat-containing protein [Chloroflexota bacterium]